MPNSHVVSPPRAPPIWSVMLTGAIAVAGCSLRMQESPFDGVAPDLGNDASSSSGEDPSTSPDSSSTGGTTASNHTTTGPDPNATSGDPNAETTGNQTSDTTSDTTSNTTGEPLARFPEGTTHWLGTYSCPQGETLLDLTLTRAEPEDTLAGTFSFGPTATNPSVPEGSFELTGTHDPNDATVELNPGDWVQQPEGWVTVALEGTYDAATNSISGDVISEDCTTFDVTQQ